MEYNRALSRIFGVSVEGNASSDFSSCLSKGCDLIDEKMKNFKEPDNDYDSKMICPGSMVVWDTESTDSLSNLVKISKDRLSLLSQSAFSTLKANATIFGGKFMYEVQLKSKGVMQIVG